jgi:hypothetical protein
MGIGAQQQIERPVAPPIDEFSLVLGGPLYQLLLRSRLIRPPLGNLRSRIGVISGLAWLPLVPLTIAGGRFFHGVKIPFLYDFEVHARLLFALPLLIFAELIVYMRMRALTAQFIERHIVTDEVRPAFDKVIASAARLRNSIPVEIALLLIAVLAGPHVWSSSLALRTDTWYGTVSPKGLNFTAAGYWYGFVSVPIFQFILLRWYYRILIWFRFLFQVSRLNLNLIALHPDRCCGLGFLGNVVASFAPILMAHSGLFAGYIANRILHEGAKLPDFRFEIVGMATVLLTIVLGPLCVFVPKLNRARLAGLRTYGTLASDYVVGFAGKWAGGNRAEVEGTEPLLGTADIQSLADLANSFAVVKEVRLVPFGKEAFTRFLIVIAIPLSPLILTMFSPEELLQRLIKVVI